MARQGSPHNAIQLTEHAPNLLKKRVTFADAGKRLVLGVVPAGSYVIDCKVVVGVAFNGSGTDIIDVGTAKSSDLTEIDFDGFGAYSVATKGVVTSTAFAASTEGFDASTSFAVVCDYADASGNATAGEAMVLVQVASGETNE